MFVWYIGGHLKWRKISIEIRVLFFVLNQSIDQFLINEELQRRSILSSKENMKTPELMRILSKKGTRLCIWRNKQFIDEILFSITGTTSCTDHCKYDAVMQTNKNIYHSVVEIKITSEVQMKTDNLFHNFLTKLNSIINSFISYLHLFLFFSLSLKIVFIDCVLRPLNSSRATQLHLR